MIAICPAGPPKLMKPSLSQKRNASAKLTGCRTPSAGGVVGCVPSDRSGAGAPVPPSAIIAFFVHRGAAASGEKHVEPLPTCVERSCVRALLGGHPLLEQHVLTVNHVDRSGLPDRHVQELASGIEPGGIRFAADWQAGYLLILCQIQRHDHARVAGDEPTLAAGIEVQTVRTSPRHRDLRPDYTCAGVERDHTGRV